MLPYKNLLSIDKYARTAVFDQIATQIVGLIQSGKLLPGTILPSTRILASELDLHRKTVMAAYNKLVADEWVESLPRKGYIVSDLLPIIKPKSYSANRSPIYNVEPNFAYRALENFNNPSFLLKRNDVIVDDGFPDTSLLPVEPILREFRKSFDFPVLNRINYLWEPQGLADFRTVLCDFLNRTRGLDIKAENLLTTRGAQMAIYIAAAMIIKPGDKVIVSEPGYFFANKVFESLGANLLYVPVDEFGMSTDRVAELIESNNVKLVYVIPHHHHPTTVTMSVSRRNHLLQIIRKYQLVVIEDDYDYDFQYQYEPYLPLATENHNGNIIYIGSISKVFGMPFRLGYLIAGEKFVAEATKWKTIVDLKGDVFMEQVTAGLIVNGELSRTIQKANKIYKKRYHYLEGLLETELENYIQFFRPNGGMALWLKFDKDFPLSNTIKKASHLGLRIMGSTYLVAENAEYNALRFGFASLQEDKLDRAISIFKKAISI